MQKVAKWCRALAVMASLAALWAECGRAQDVAGKLPVADNEPVRGRVIRQIEDVSTGTHWLLVEDAEHPAGPRRFVQESGISMAFSTRIKPVVLPVPPVILPGDRLTVEEHTAVSDLTLEGVSLGRAGKGQKLDVRLKLNGNVVHTVALAPGKAMLASAGRESQ